MMDNPRRDTVVMGASAGGLDALSRVVAQFPRGLDAAVLVVQHMGPTNEPMLAGILQRQTEVSVDWAQQGDRIETGRVYIAPPAVHMLIVDDHLQLTGGPRENHVRPSIDRLFRSAAARRGNRTIGVLLTGMLDDGVAGLRAIRDAGGLAIVQDPLDAAYPELPSRALQAFRPDRVLPVDAIGKTILEFLRAPASSTAAPDRVAIEAELDRDLVAREDVMDRLGQQVSISCPECRGPLWDVGDEGLRRYRCYLRHVVSAQQVLRLGSDQIETAMWSAIRALHDRASTYEALAADAGRAGAEQTRLIYANRAAEARAQSDLARTFMLEVLATSTGA